MRQQVHDSASKFDAVMKLAQLRYVKLVPGNHVDEMKVLLKGGSSAVAAATPAQTKKKGGKEAGGKEAGGKEAGGKEVGGKEAKGGAKAASKKK